MNRMIASIHFCCDTPGCKSTCTISPQDAKDGPDKALESRGWEVTGTFQGAEEGDPKSFAAKTVTCCICFLCAEKAKNQKESVK